MLTQAGSSFAGEIHTEIVSRAVQKRVSKNFHKANSITKSLLSRLGVSASTPTYAQYKQFGYNTYLQKPAEEVTCKRLDDYGAEWDFCPLRPSKPITEDCACGVCSPHCFPAYTQQNSRQNATLHGLRVPFLHKDHVLERHSSVSSSSHQHRDDRLTDHHRRDISGDRGTSSDRRLVASGSSTSSCLPVPTCPSRKEAIQLLPQHQRDRILAADVNTRCRVLDIIRKCDTIIERLRNPAAAAKPFPTRNSPNRHSSDTNGCGSNKTVDITATEESTEDPVPLESTKPTKWFVELDLHAFRFGIVVIWNPFHRMVTTSPWSVPLPRFVFDRGKV